MRVPAEARSHARQNDVRHVVQLAGMIEQGVLEEQLLRARAPPPPFLLAVVERVQCDDRAEVAHRGRQADGHRFGAQGEDQARPAQHSLKAAGEAPPLGSLHSTGRANPVYLCGSLEPPHRGFQEDVRVPRWRGRM